ncbi:hypothetical protein [Stenotrophomonas sp.]|uniref:hypothetical protein n=1 Tax=Stenotrophomonas sp. TaxID=69392 RepID=UPI00289E67F6|nr:hypothetical protein [Stenotrophomonas sp.]
MTAPLPLPVDHVAGTQTVAALAAYAQPLLDAIARQAQGQGSASEDGSAAGLIEALARIVLALQSAEPAQLRRQAGWWGRLLGRDVERQRDADALQPQLGVLLVQAEDRARALQARAVQRQTAMAAADQATLALERWIEVGSLQLPRLSATDQHAVFAQRLDHLRRLAALQRSEAAQWQLLQAQDDALLARFRRIADVLLPAWKQAALARQAQDQTQRNQQAAQLQAQIVAEVASAQARLR